ncbi:response regulator [Paenibacillus sp. CGMCC 1.16610]|uniref:Response regulator n=1 Tax=Paenibacillus anseongense TaxID=2682845 RepID=A0ABW9U2U5_9BACL|nr:MULTISPECIES: response regulator [Paenibacillus]MBA2941805.1 response regulator [Paenibacillus sp. CGMCC 1.16610]MVQ34323.1 response regulator [Paenibacillus anseongense]
MDILIVDDETVIREGIQRTLLNRFPEHQVHLAANAEQAIALLRSHRIQIVLTDILMPGMTGLELMNMSRSRHPNVKWVVISAYSEFSYAQEAVRLGAKDYLLKPIGKEVLSEMIRKLGEEIAHEIELNEESELLKANRKYLQEAVFQRFVQGLDTGRIDMKPFMEQHPHFHLIMVKMESDKAVFLENFIIENVLQELIERYGKGFVTVHDSKSLLGVVTLPDAALLTTLVDELRSHLVKYLKVPFQIMSSEQINRFEAVPAEVQRMRQASTTQVYEHHASGSDRSVDVALQYIRTHYHDDLSLEKVAAIVYLNPVYFSQLFKQKIGQGFKEYVTHLRLEQAKQLLLNPKLKLADVADRIGYQDMRHFSQVFRKKYGVTPSEYRNEQTPNSV